MVAAIALVTAYLAFGRHLAVKLIGVAVVVVVLATPGLAVGYANGLVSASARRGRAATTPADTAAIAAADAQVDRPIPNKPMNILLIGSDKSAVPGDPGRSDTQMLVRLDPETKSISMLSLPRDLQVDIPGVGLAKMNEAYSYGGPALVIETFKQLTGLPINGWIEVNFSGFWHVVNILGGVYLPIDHKYFVPASADYKSINLEPGYQLVRGKQALNYVRFRHDQTGDFTRMQRQQLFLKEVQRQSGRWSGDWTKVLRLIKAITGETKSNLSSLQEALAARGAGVRGRHVQGLSGAPRRLDAMIDGISYVTATDGEIADVVDQFTNPTQAPVVTKGTKIGKKMFPVRVYNGSGIAGRATPPSQLSVQGYDAEAVADAIEYPDTITAVYAPESLEAQANASRRRCCRLPTCASSRAPPAPATASACSSLRPSTASSRCPRRSSRSSRRWRRTRRSTGPPGRSTTRRRRSSSRLPLRGRPGSPTTSGATTPSRRPTASTPPPRSPSSRRRSTATGASRRCAGRIRRPSRTPTATQTIGGRKFMLFYQGDHLHMVAWKEHGTLYWVLNTLDNQLSNDLLLGLAASCEPVK